MDEVIAKRYAEALFQIGLETGTSADLMEECRTVEDALAADDDWRGFLDHPGISNNSKEAFIDNAFQGFSNTMINTLKLLVRRHRHLNIPSVMRAYIKLYNADAGIAEGKVYSVTALSQDVMDNLAQTLAKRFGKQEMKLENIIDQSVIGGIKVQVDNTILDGSLTGKLRRMEREILSANL